MVDWKINTGSAEIQGPAGKLILACPCDLNHQKTLLQELQRQVPRFQVLTLTNSAQVQRTPILVAKFLLTQNGLELKALFEWWLDQSKLVLDEELPLFKLIPQTESQWNDLKIEKRLALFAGVLILSHNFSHLFLGDLHLEQNAQTFLFNFLKHLTESSSHQFIVYWSYRLQVANTVPLYFKGFQSDAA